MADAYDFDYPWRPIYEWQMTGVWLGAATLMLAVTKTLPVPTRMGVTASLICIGIGGVRALQAWRRSQDSNRIRLAEKQFVQIPEMLRIAQVASARECIWLGSGFHWTDIEASRMHSLIGRGIAAQMGKELLHKDGAYWLHGLAKEGDIYGDLGNLVGHTLIVGTTRVGKTRMFDLLIAQSIARGEPVIIIDPKGDHGLAENARKVCEARQQGDRFIYFHPAHPRTACCIRARRVRQWRNHARNCSCRR